MSIFTGSLVIEELRPGRLWRLAQPLHYEVGAEGSGKWIEVPAGFQTDGATLPAPLKLMLAVWGTYGRAACLHDYCYGQLLNGTPLADIPTRQAADNEFHIAMRACGTGKALAFIMWAAVRAFGWIYINPLSRGAS